MVHGATNRPGAIGEKTKEQEQTVVTPICIPKITFITF